MARRTVGRLLVVLLLAASGCGPSTPHATRPPTPTPSRCAAPAGAGTGIYNGGDVVDLADAPNAPGSGSDGSLLDRAGIPVRAVGTDSYTNRVFLVADVVDSRVCATLVDRYGEGRFFLQQGTVETAR